MADKQEVWHGVFLGFNLPHGKKVRVLPIFFDSADEAQIAYSIIPVGGNIEYTYLFRDSRLVAGKSRELEDIKKMGYALVERDALNDLFDCIKKKDGGIAD